MLGCASFYTVLAHGGMLSLELKRVVDLWNSPHQQNSLPVLGILAVIL